MRIFIIFFNKQKSTLFHIYIGVQRELNVAQRPLFDSSRSSDVSKLSRPSLVQIMA